MRSNHRPLARLALGTLLVLLAGAPVVAAPATTGTMAPRLRLIEVPRGVRVAPEVQAAFKHWALAMQAARREQQGGTPEALGPAIEAALTYAKGHRPTLQKHPNYRRGLAEQFDLVLVLANLYLKTATADADQARDAGTPLDPSVRRRLAEAQDLVTAFGEIYGTTSAGYRAGMAKVTAAKNHLDAAP